MDCRIIDIELQPSDEVTQARLAKQILTELQTDTGNSMVAYRGPYRWASFFEPAQYPSIVKNRLKPGGVYLITGGLGGIGLTVAEYLARTQQAKLVLLGRSIIPAREHWQEILSATGKEDSLRHKIKNIMQLEKLGAKVLIVNADARQ